MHALMELRVQIKENQILRRSYQPKWGPNYMLSADGYLTPTKNEQVPAGLRYFRRTEK